MPMKIRFHPHAMERMMERGATEDEVRSAIEGGERFVAKYGRVGFRRNYPFNAEWRVRMKLTYDPEYNIAYLRLREKKGEVTTVKISDELNVDLAPDGIVYGIELLNANKQLSADHGAFIVELADKHREIQLAA